METMTRSTIVPKIEIDSDSINDQEIISALELDQTLNNQYSIDHQQRQGSPRLGAQRPGTPRQGTPNKEKLSVKQATTVFGKQAIAPLIARSVSFAVVDPRSMANRHGAGEQLSIPGTPDFIGGGSSEEGPGIFAIFLTIISLLIITLTLPFSLFFCIKVVQEYERAVIFRLGRLVKGGARGPGIFFIIPCIDTYCKVDLRTVSFDVPPQEILSKDSVTVSVDAVVYYRISNAIIAVANVEDYNRSTRLLAASTLRNVLGTKNLTEILSERETISRTMQSALDDATDPWGVQVERVEVKDVRLPVMLQRAMAAEAEAAREARAKVIMAEGELRASFSLRDAGQQISEAPQAIQLRYLQTLSSIASEHNSTIVFPMPMDLFERLYANSAMDVR